MNKRIFGAVFAMVLLVSFAVSGQTNLLRNPEFQFFSNTGSNTGSTVTAWESDEYGDVIVTKGAARPTEVTATGNVVEMKPGKRIWQYASIPELGLVDGDAVSMSVKGYQSGGGGALKAHLAIMLIESETGTWTSDYPDNKSTYQKHGRGELIRVPDQTTTSGTAPGEFFLQVNNAAINPVVVQNVTSSSSHRNIVGVLVEFENVTAYTLWIHSPVLVKGASASLSSPAVSRALPDYYRHIPRTMEKIKNGEPLHIISLGSSIDKGTAYPRLAFYNEDPTSPNFKDEIIGGLSSSDKWYDYYGTHGNKASYLCNVGRTKRWLAKQYDYSPSELFFLTMARGSKCIAEAHSGFVEFTNLTGDAAEPHSVYNAHRRSGKTWAQLYPTLFTAGNPKPDLVIFGHGHNERIDLPNHEAAAYEGTIRWFQRHFPEVEFVSCMWVLNKGSAGSVWPAVSGLAANYGIPFIDAGQFVQDIQKTCNYRAITPDKSHPQAGGQYLWSKIFQQAFHLPAVPEAGIPQIVLPARYDEQSYNWEGEMTRYMAGDARIVGGKSMILDDCAFSSWTEGSKANIRIDAKLFMSGAGGGSPITVRPSNATFFYGDLALGDRHVIEIVGSASFLAVDSKNNPGRTYHAADATGWKKTGSVEPFPSTWGAPYGTKMFTIAAGVSATINVTATDLSIAYVDKSSGGTLEVEVDGTSKLTVATNVPYKNNAGASFYIENRKGIRNLTSGAHAVTVKATGGEVQILGLYAYDKASTKVTEPADPEITSAATRGVNKLSRRPDYLRIRS